MEGVSDSQGRLRDTLLPTSLRSGIVTLPFFPSTTHCRDGLGLLPLQASIYHEQ